DLLALIRGLKAAGVSVVLVSHDLEEVAEVADRVCAMERGAVRAVGTPAEVFYGSPELAPATVRTVVALGEARQGIGKPVRFGETLEALRALAGG
ncbi:MAG: ABC transporter ATP-binding protein, partial [Rubrobacter sp.]